MVQTGQLLIIGTPIGNLGDLTTRAKTELQNVALLAAEDTRRARKLLAHLALRLPLIRCDEHHMVKAITQIQEHLAMGHNVGFITDAGMPGLSDPGYRLVMHCRINGFPIVPIPGVSAVTTALAICGFPATPFTFWGFLPRKPGARLTAIEALLTSHHSSVVFESPHRVVKLVDQMAAITPQHWLFIGRELTKVFEQTYFGTMVEIVALLHKKTPRGEFTLVIAPQSFCPTQTT